MYIIKWLIVLCGLLFWVDLVLIVKEKPFEFSLGSKNIDKNLTDEVDINDVYNYYYGLVRCIEG